MIIIPTSVFIVTFSDEYAKSFSVIGDKYIGHTTGDDSLVALEVSPQRHLGETGYLDVLSRFFAPENIA